MSYGNIRTALLLNTITEEIEAVGDAKIESINFAKSLAAIKIEFPQLSEQQSLEMLLLIIDAYNCKLHDKMELIVTAPVSFALKTKVTLNAVNEILQDTKESILMTGYSISDYVNDFLDIIVEKSQRGVFFKLFINNAEKQTAIDKILRYKSKFLQIYNYSNKNDKMAALHAKVITSDGKKSLISSANLSYHGMSGNIELGCLIESVEIAKKIDDIFNELIFQKVITRV